MGPNYGRNNYESPPYLAALQRVFFCAKYKKKLDSQRLRRGQMFVSIPCQCEAACPPYGFGVCQAEENIRLGPVSSVVAGTRIVGSCPNGVLIDIRLHVAQSRHLVRCGGPGEARTVPSPLIIYNDFTTPGKCEYTLHVRVWLLLTHLPMQ